MWWFGKVNKSINIVEAKERFTSRNDKTRKKMTISKLQTSLRLRF